MSPRPPRSTLTDTLFPSRRASELRWARTSSRKAGRATAASRLRTWSCATRRCAIEVPVELVPDMIDEFPILAIAAACARGTTVVRGAAELRVKESDRIAAMAAGLRSLGVHVEERPAGALIEGGTLDRKSVV